MNVLKFVQIAVLFWVVFAKDEPQFLGPGRNVTVVVGRDATLTCEIQHLHDYKVAWLRVDTQTVLTIGPHVITKNKRVGVARRDPSAWALTVRGVQPGDGGRYMCQINTEPMITQTHLLQVVVPPDIVESGTSSEVMASEGDNVTLHCSASGTPAPNITWRREDSKSLRTGVPPDIVESGTSSEVMAREGDNVTLHCSASGTPATNITWRREDSIKSLRIAVNKWAGEWLNMSAVTRESNGPFLCIATNGVPPSVSKRIMLHILCAPTVWAVQKMVGGYVGSSALLQCRVEANPLPAVYWTHIDSPRLQYGSKYQASMTSEGIRHTAALTVNNVSRDDIGTYYCHVENSLGKGRGDVTLYTLATTAVSTITSSTTSTTFYTQVEVATDETHVQHFDDHHKNEDKDFSEEDNYVVVLSQHQMQNLDFSSSS